MIAVFQRELKAYFSSILAWVLTSLYLLIVGFLVAVTIQRFADISMAQMRGMGAPSVMEQLVPALISMMAFLLLFFLPLLTMRLFAEEKRSGTLDLLLTYPLTEAQIIGGKFMAAMSVVLMMLAFTLSGFILLSKMTAVEWQVIGMGYLGLLLLACAIIGYGLWASSLTASQLVAAAVTYCGLLILWVFSEFQTDWMKDTFGDMSALNHLNSLSRGVLDTQDLVYYLGLTFLFLFLTARVLESRKWRG